MQKIIKVDNTTVVVFEDGTSLQRDNLTPSEFSTICSTKNKDEIIGIMCPEYKEMCKKKAKIDGIMYKIKESSILTEDRNTVYWKEVSQLSVPKELVEAILEAEEINDEVLLDTYKNFWTLMSLNPNEQCRLNLFWFLNKNGLVLSRSGFFVAYRNADKTTEEGVFTDHHSHTFKIKMGEMVTMPREKCDDNQDVTCSRGLHLGANWWLQKNYYGNTGLVCLCNPADVVAVPHDDSYGKLRTCAYLPIDFAQFGDDGKVIPYDKSNGFICEYVPKVIYEGLMGTESETNYKIEIPNIPGIDKETISNNLLDLARETIINRVQ